MCDFPAEIPITKDKPIEFGEREKMLGVAVNRETRQMLNTHGETDTHYNDSSGTVTIDIEHDPQLFTFLCDIKDALRAEGPKTPTEIARVVAAEVITKTPNVDIDGSFHQHRAITLGEALNNPIHCIDRALAIEAGLKIGGIETAKSLICIDRANNGRDTTNHADVVFEDEKAGKNVVITTGSRAGQVMPFPEYQTSYLLEREANGLGKREIKETWGRPYFQKVKG